MRPEQTPFTGPIHTPHAHAGHDPRVPCGCQTDLSKGGTVCECGAVYVERHVDDFPRWVCYDCKVPWVKKELVNTTWYRQLRRLSR